MSGVCRQGMQMRRPPSGTLLIARWTATVAAKRFIPIVRLGPRGAVTPLDSLFRGSGSRLGADHDSAVRPSSRGTRNRQDRSIDAVPPCNAAPSPLNPSCTRLGVGCVVPMR